MLLSEMPGHKYPVIAIFPFRWYETNRWIIRALKLRPNDELSWMDHSIESNGHAKAQTFGNYEDAREEATAFNLGIATRVAALDFQAETKTSITLKAEKEITVLQRLAYEEQLMFNEAVKRNAHRPRPRSEDLFLSTDLEILRGELLEQITRAPYIQIAHLPRWGMVLARTGELDWSRRLAPTKKNFISCCRETIARGFGMSGTDHWGKTKAAIRAMLLPRANQLLQHASIQKILLEARARGQRVVVMVASYFGTKNVAHRAG
ncbi:hypothetical protein [Pseudomonas sp. WCS374]|uniref:hypothetical protein n=1 Tax=Pseudomonas sp. WCS374 TaxID=1495331 RepID=UPI00210B99AC|nr:hypothetical protein [Pseudomonas sp. WCS374]